MKLEHHIATSTIVSGTLFLITGSWGLSISSFASGIFTDVDHIFDYVLTHRFRFNVQEIMHFFYREKHQKITIVFHGWEWLLSLCLATVLSGFNPWLTGVFIGYGHHLITDYFYSRTDPRTYSLIWRWMKKFNSKILFPRNRGYNP